MNELSGLNGQNILGNFEVLNQGLIDANASDYADLNQIQSDGAYTDPILSEAIELTTIESSLGDLGLELFAPGVSTVFNLASASPLASKSDNYAVFAEGKLVIRGISDFDGDPLNPRDDAYIYTGSGFDIKSNSTFPILRNDAGEPILDGDRKQQLIEGAVVVADGYSKVSAKPNRRNLSGLTPPEVVPATVLEIPAYTDTVNDELTRRIAPGSEPIIFNAKQNKIRNAADWNNLFPLGGTEANPAYVRVVGGKLDIPNNVNLSHYNIIVEKGSVKFKGSNNVLDDVLLFAESGKLEAKRLVANNVSLLASDKIDIKSESQFTGENLIANGKGDIEFKSTVVTPNETDSLRIISADDLELKSRSNLRGQLLAKDDLNVRGRSTFYGSLGAKDDINFYGGVEVYATPNEPEPSATIDSVTVSEGDSGSLARLTVSLSNESSSPLSVDYATAEGTATSGTDYQTTTGTLAFEPGEISSTIEVPIVGDNVYEADEAFTVELSNPNGITLNEDTATVEILNDDPQPAIAIANVEVIEDNGTAKITLELSNPSSRAITLDYATVDGTAIAGSDYQASFGTITIEPGQTSQTIAVELIDDSIYEKGEAFTIEFSNSDGATLAEASNEVTATIIENDELPALSINSVVATEGVDPFADIVITLDQPAAVSVTVEYVLTQSRVNSTATATTKGTITLAPGEISQTIASIPVVEDAIDELEEIYTVELSDPVNATIVTGQGTATIIDNDPTPQLSVADFFINEGNDGTSSVTYTVALDNPSDREITVDYFTADGTATAGVDYQPKTGTLAFAPGETSKTVTIAVTGDNLDEVNETFWLNLDNATNAVISELQGTLTIIDDDNAPVATVNEVSIIEDGEEFPLAVFTVELDAPSGKEISLDYTTLDGTAVAGSDYVATEGTVTFAPGETTKTIEVEIIGDTLDEVDEAFTLALSSPTNVALVTTETIATITDNDEPPTVAVDNVTLTELDEGTNSALFTVTLDNPSERQITVGYSTSDGTAIEGEDYVASEGTITFEPGETSKAIEVAVTGDRVFEEDEAFTVELSNPNFVIIDEERGIGTGTIVNNNLPPLELSFSLADDTGASNTDNISSSATIDGAIANLRGNASLNASFSGNEPTDVSDLISPDGSFTINLERLEQVNGGDLGDGTYTLQLVATDSETGEVSESELVFTLDTTSATLNLTTPLASGNHNSKSRLTGNTDASDLNSVTYSLDGKATQTAVVEETGYFDVPLNDGSFEAGTHSVAVTATDIAGNTSSSEVSFEVGNVIFTPDETDGWGAKSDSTVILGEQDSYVVQTQVPVELGLETNDEGELVGTRTLRFDLNAVWDETDTKAIEDQLLVYLVNPEDPSQTLLDDGTPGSAVFSVAGEQSDFTPGLVSFDGTTVTIDASSLTDLDEGLLVFQLLNQDNDTGSVVTVNNLASITDTEGFANPIFPEDSNLVEVGSELNLNNLNQATDVETIIENVRFDADTGEYKAQIGIKNNGETAISRNSAVVFNNLPDGVELNSPSGTDSNGNPYINLRPAIRPGGLDIGGVSDNIEVTFTNPSLIRFSLDTTVLVGNPNAAPVFEPIGNLTVIPGEKLEIPLAATDVDGDKVTYKLEADEDLPTGMLDGNGTLKFNPSPDEIGSYEFTIIATDGAEEVTQAVTLDVVADPVTTTRISGTIQNVQLEPLAGVPIELGDLQTVTDADGSFIIETDQPLTADTLIIRGEEIDGNKVYPYIAEKLPLVLGQDVYEGYSNVIERPIYLPALDVESGQIIDPSADTTITTENIPGASVFVEAGSLSTQEGEAFTGTLSITEVPNDLTPAALPENLSPDMVVTIQPGEMIFETPAPLSLPNRAGWAAGLEMDLWSINPETGDFDKVGKGRVSDDGTVVETIDGGIRNSSWHLFAPPPQNPGNSNPPPDCDECQEKFPFKSEVEASSGAVIEEYDLVSYSSNGESRGISLTYDSLRADPRPIVKLDYGDIDFGNTSPGALRIIADLTVKGNGIDYQVPGGIGNNHFWSISRQTKNSSISLQADLKEFESGKYDYDFTNGLYLFTRGDTFGSSRSFEDKLLHVNSIDSAFGSGWGIAGWQEIVENSDGSLLLIDGDGSELWFDAPENEGEPYINPPGDFSTLEKLPDGSFRRTMKEGMVYDFNQSNQLASVTDTNGNSTEYVYDSQDRLNKIIDPVGLETVLTYNSAGKVSSIIDPAQRETLMEYDNDGNLISITDPDNSTSQWSYDGGHHMISEVDPEGNRAEATYDQFGRATSATTEDGSVVQIKPLETQGLYSPNATTNLSFAPVAGAINNNEVTYADANGNVVSTELDLSGQKISSVDGSGVTGNTERNQDNLIASQTNARGNTTEYTYDEQGNVTKITEDLFSSGLIEETEAEFIFSDPQYRVSGASAFDSGDINKDGYLDIVTGGSILLGNSDGTFRSSTDYDTNIGANTVSLEDVNNDNNLDLILFGWRGASVSLGNGNGTFESSIYNDVTVRVTEGTVSDFNDDGNLDLIILNNNDGVISIHSGNGDGTFDLLNEYALEIDTSRISSVVFEDLDLDEDLDLVVNYTQYNSVTNSNEAYFDTFLNDSGSFTLQEKSLIGDSNSSAGRTDVGDLNGDNIPDLVVSNRYSKYQRRPLTSIDRMDTSVYLGNGDGTFILNDRYSTNNTYSFVSGLSLEDLNNDGNLDLIQSNGLQSLVRLGNGDGTLSEEQSYNVGYLIDSLLVEDWNNDGNLDLGTVDGRENFSIQFGNGDGTFAVDTLSVSSRLDNSYSSLRDINNDGLLDIISKPKYESRDDSNIVSVALGKGDGTFSSRIDTATDGGVETFTLEDLNKDNNLDLIVTLIEPFSYRSRKVSIMLGKGDGTFNSGTSYDLPDLAYLTIVGDIDGDDNIDLISKDYNGISILPNNGDATFSIQTYDDLDTRYINTLALSDLDGNGSLDLVGNGEKISVWLNDGSGNFVSSGDYDFGNNSLVSSGRSFVVEDLDEDGDEDLIVETYDENLGASFYVSILLNNGNGTFALENNYDVDPDYISFSIKLDVDDVTGDGIPDLVYGSDYFGDNYSSNPYSYWITVLEGNGNGIFENKTTYTVPGSATSLNLRDLDNDGDSDLVYGYYQYDTRESGIAVKLNRINQSDGANTLAERYYTYDPIFNRVTSETDELGRVTLYDIDPNNGNLLSTTKVVGEVGGDDDVTTSYTYNNAGLVDTTTDPLGRVTDYDYDLFGNLTKETYALGTTDEAVLQYEYDLAGNQTAVIDENGNHTEFEYDAENRLIKSTYAVGTSDEAVETTEYDGNGNQTATVDANGNRTEYKYDEKDRLIETIAPDPDGDGELTSPISTSTYDSMGNLIAITDPLGRETRYVYDSRNRLIETILPDGIITESKYDTDNNLIASSDAAGKTTNKIFDARGRLIRETDPQGNVTRYQYDAANQLLAVVDGNGNRTSYEYDELGRQIAVTDGESNVTRTEYDKAGNVVATVDGLGNRTEYGFDERDRNTAVTDAEDGTTTTEYDGVGNVLSVTDPVNNQTSYTYDAQNRVAVETNELGFTRTFEYDDVGNSISTTDRNGREREFQYDGLNRQVEENWLDNAGNSIRTTNSEYDVANQLIATDDPDSAYNFTYDELGRMVTVDNAGTEGVPNVVLTYNYDEEGNIISVSDTIDGEAGATTAYSYNELDRVDLITQSGENVADKRVDFDYDAIGQHTSTTRYSNLSGTNLVADSSFTYDDANRLIDLTHSNDTTEIANYDLTYDAASRITQIVDADGTNDYSYDKRNQLTAAVHSDESNADETYSYDSNGNRTDSSLHGSGYVTDANNRLASDGTYNYEYDQSGNLISQTEIATGNVQEMEWDYLNRLVAVVDKDAAGNEIQTVEFTYDMFGKRLSKIVDGEATYFVYDRDNVILDFVDDSDGVVLDKRYLHGERIDQVLAQESGTGNVTWHLSDHLGSVRDLVDNDGNAVNHYVYDSFGNVVSQTGETVISRYLYTGREWDDEIGLQYNRARYYNPELGRFINEDPIGFSSEDNNLYRYVENSPVNTIDPLGLYGLVVFQTRSISYEDNGIKQTNNIQTVIDAYQRNSDVEITSDTTYAYIWYASTNTGTDANQRINPPGRRPILDDRGHIVGKQLGGSGDDPNNLFAQNAIFNQNAWRLAFETPVRNYLDANGSNPACPLDLNYTVNLTYDKLPFNQRLRPVAVGGTARFSDGKFIPGFVFNP